jgi:hypothetical protein
MAPQVPIVAPTKSSSEFLGKIKQFASLRRSTPSVFPLQPRWKFLGTTWDLSTQLRSETVNEEFVGQDRGGTFCPSGLRPRAECVL